MRRGVVTEMARKEGVELVAEELTNCSCDCRPRGARLEAGHVSLGGVGALASKQEDARRSSVCRATLLDLRAREWPA